MGGVDVYDQLAIVFKKYYKQIFLGLVDMTLANCYIAHREAKKRSDQEVMDNAKFLQKLQLQLLALTSDYFVSMVSCSSFCMYWAG